MKIFCMIIGLLMLGSIKVKGKSDIKDLIIIITWVLAGAFLVAFPLYLEFVR